MGQALQEFLRGKRKAQMLLQISIKKVKTKQKSATRAARVRKHSRIQKIMYRKRGKTHKAPARSRRARRHEARRSGSLRGVRSRRMRQKKRVRFALGKQALPAFFLFMADHRRQLQGENPDWTMVDIAKELGYMWHQQPRKDKERYKREAKRLRRQKRKRRA